MSALRGKWPDVSVPAVGLCQVLGLPVGTSLASCPVCKQKSVVLHRYGRETYGYCGSNAETSCSWQGSLFQLYCETSGQGPLAAIKTLRREKVRIPKATDAPAVLTAYQKHLNARNAFVALETAMAARILRQAASPTHTQFGASDRPHAHPFYWSTTPAELGGFLDGHTDSDSTADRRLLCSTDDEYFGPCLAVPGYDPYGRINSVWVCRSEDGSTSHCFRGLKYGGTRVFFQASLKYASEESKTAVVYAHQTEALREVVAAMRSNPGPHAGIVLSGRAVDLPYLRQYNWLLDRNLHLGHYPAFDGRVYVGTSFAEYFGGSHQTDRDSVDWPVYVASFFGTASPYNRAKHMTEIGWSPAIADRLAPYLSDATKRAIAAEVRNRIPTDPVRLDEHTSVVDTALGWADYQTGKILAEAVPVHVVTYRASGKVRHRGLVRYGTSTYPFDTGHFQKNAAAVVESVLAKAGVTQIPHPHPTVAFHMARIALYWSRRDRDL